MRPEVIAVSPSVTLFVLNDIVGERRTGPTTEGSLFVTGNAGIQDGCVNLLRLSVA